MGERPTAINRAQWVLWAWTAWMCLFGVYQLWTLPTGFEDVVQQFQSTTGIATGSLRTVGLGFYALVLVSMVTLILQIGAGRRWARFMLLVSFILEAVWVVGQLDFSADQLADVPDLLFQIYALYLIYTAPGRDWFKPKTARV